MKSSKFLLASLFLQLVHSQIHGHESSVSNGHPAYARTDGPAGTEADRSKLSVGAAVETRKSIQGRVAEKDFKNFNAKIGVGGGNVTPYLLKAHEQTTTSENNNGKRHIYLKVSGKNSDKGLGKPTVMNKIQKLTGTPGAESSQQLHITPDKDEDNKAKFFFAGYSTTTDTIVILTTSSTPVTCVLGSATVAGGAPPRCTGRRKKRSQILNFDRASDTSRIRIDSSQDSEIDSEVDFFEKSKAFFTIWTQVFTTTTLTTFVTNKALTLSLSYYCSVGNLDVPSIGC
ncbi:uncharacterized protein LOC108678128 [Hyalella azteca]|uniref:Uncharacterized protein LOC108678128 n=1 Tax=Hyalella azteca TaxID=294128 RepID=A0A8B7P7N3_HYAAZ|nr:uncharacterized protein LOC108678128 [Hyalella azteca]